jgi:hypothetical protein
MQAANPHKRLGVLSAFPSRGFGWDFSVGLPHGRQQVSSTSEPTYPQDFSVADAGL